MSRPRPPGYGAAPLSGRLVPPGAGVSKRRYQGRACYLSELIPGRAPIALADPLEVILSEADRLGMHVLPGVGCYVFFDYTPGALAWCQRVAQELLLPWAWVSAPDAP